MKKWIIALVFVFAAGIVFGHPPTVEKVVYDPATKIVTITVTYNIGLSPVTDIKKHYVKEVTVTVNGARVVLQDFTTQETPESEILVYKLLVKSGDKVTVDAQCSIAGIANKTITIP